MTPLDREWLTAHPLPAIDFDTDKNSRGRLLVAGGSELVPGALLLSGEAGYRAGAGKVQLAVPNSSALAVGIRMPESAVFGMPVNEKGELGPAPERLAELIDRCDALVLGPGMGSNADASALLKAVLAHGEDDVALLLDAAAIAVSPDFAEELRAWPGPLVLTPHPGEMAALMRCDAEAVCEAMASEAAERFGATVLLKGPDTVIASPGQTELRFHGGGPGLATGGSGDVLAGIIGGLLARGADARTAAAWGVWAHGEAGRALSRSTAPLGFMARELLPLVPGLIYGAAAR
jgi:hydroxyethylthiazole kinase-like uncharacterized protein yjeF